jgi:cap2 methyltransferase
MGYHDRKLYLLNPHCRQVFATYRHPIETTQFSRVLDSNSPRMRYQRRRNEWKTTEHWGQRKLLMSEIEFLTMHAKKGRVVVYAGAAPGDHTNFLSEMFPEVTFVLVDPSPFTTKPSDKITIIQDFFTDELAASFATEEYKDRVLFVSDIRSFDSTQDDMEKEERVQIDMEMQQRWVETIQPVACMLKLRFPYKRGMTEYLDGDIYLPVWGPRTTSEARLIATKPYTKRKYQHSYYEDGMYAHNATVRSAYHDVSDWHLSLGVGYDRCYDCMAEIHIIEQYLASVSHLEDDGTLSFLGLVERIDAECSKSGRTLGIRRDIDDYVWEEAGL